MRIDAVVVRLLSALVCDAGQLVPKSELIARVWDGRAVSDNVITVAMVRLRKTLGHVPGEREFIVNSHGRGYRFVRPVIERVVPSKRAPQAVSVAPERSPFVGREAVMARLGAALAAAEGGHGSLVLLMGEAGIGKTRVVEWLTSEAANAGIPAAWGYCPEAGDAPALWPLSQLVRALCAALPELTSELAPELRWFLSCSSPARSPEPLDEPRAKHALFEAMSALFERASPAVLVLEDLHRADAASLELLRSFVDRLARARILLVATVRTVPARDTSAPRDFAYIVGHRNGVRLGLERLAATSVAAYVSTLFPEAPPAVAAAIWSKSEGNPFFMVELTRQLRLVGGPIDVDELAVPDAALELLRPRVHALDRAARGVLSQAAVIGRCFELGVLAEVTGHPLGTLMALLDEARACEVVCTTDSCATFRFQHELLRHILYEDLRPSDRRASHLRVADVLAKRRAEDGSVAAAVLAYHYHAALPESPVAKVVAHCAEASTEAAHVFAYADALRHMRHAREALALVSGAAPPVRLALLLGHALLARICAAPEFERLSAELVHVAREHGDGGYLVHGGLLRDLHPGFPPLSGARAALEEARALLPESDRELLPAALGRLAIMPPLAYDAAQSEAAVVHAVRLAEAAGGRIARYGAHSAAHFLFGGPLDDGRARASEAAIERLCLEHPRVMTAPPVLLDLHRAIRAFQEGDIARMHAALAHAETACRTLGSRELGWHVARFRALARLLAGKHDRAVHATLRSLHRRTAVEGIVASELLCIHDEVLVLGERRPAAELRRVLSRSPDDGPTVWSLKVRVLAALGFASEARMALAMLSPAGLAALPKDRDYLGTLGALAQSALALGERAHVAALYELLAPFERQLAVHVAFFCEGPVALLSGALADALGRHHAAVQHYEVALARSTELGLASFVARAQAALAARPASV